MNSGNIAVQAKDLTVSFSRWGQEVRALDRVALSVPAGQWIMLVGHNGSGKSTLLKAVSARIKPDSGEIKIWGERIEKFPGSLLSEHLFYVHQDPLLGTAPKLTVYENLLIADHQAMVEQTPRSELARKYKDLLRPIGLADRLKQLARYLSGGERQLVALLIARLRPSSIMLLDEPLAALDPAKTELCVDLIRRLHQDQKTIIQVTHDPLLAVTCGDRTIALRDGHLAYDRTKEDRQLPDLRRAWASDVDSLKNRRANVEG